MMVVMICLIDRFEEDECCFARAHSLSLFLRLLALALLRGDYDDDTIAIALLSVSMHHDGDAR